MQMTLGYSVKGFGVHCEGHMVVRQLCSGMGCGAVVLCSGLVSYHVLNHVFLK